MKHNILTPEMQTRYLDLMEKQSRIDDAYRAAKSRWDHDGCRAIPYALMALLCLFIAPLVAPQWNDSPTLDNHLMLGVAFAVFFTPLCVLTYLHWELRFYRPHKERRHHAADALRKEVENGLEEWLLDANAALLAAGQWHTASPSSGNSPWEIKSVQVSVIGPEVWMLDIHSNPVMTSIVPEALEGVQDSTGKMVWMTDTTRTSLGLN